MAKKVAAGVAKKLAIFSIVSRNYQHYAKTLFSSVARHHPEADMFCILVDGETGVSAEYADKLSVLLIHDLGIADLKRMAFQYDILELNTAAKPWAFEALLRKGYESVVYLDPDIYLYGSLNRAIELTRTASDIVLTPHLLEPIQDDKRPTELDIRRAGTYNLGFCAVRNSSNTLNFLKWWQGKLARQCYVDQDSGIFVDQSWMDLVPGLFDNVSILRDPGYNVAYWNCAERQLRRKPDGAWIAKDAPLIFFHFSGLDHFAPDRFSKHQNRYTLSNLGPAAELVRDYSSEVLSNGAKIFADAPYGFGCFDDGTPISGSFRRLYLHNEVLREKMGENPFAQSSILTQMAQLPKSRWALELLLLALTPQSFSFSRIRRRLKRGFRAIW